jgi:hypothetical protein
MSPRAKPSGERQKRLLPASPSGFRIDVRDGECAQKPEGIT